MSFTGELKYRSVNDLCTKARINYKGMKPIAAYKRLQSMRQLAEVGRKNGDDETHYIMLKRWVDTVEWLKRTPEYKNDKSISSINEINATKTNLAELQKKLDAKYKRQVKEKISDKSASSERMDIDIEPQNKRDSYIPAIDGPINLPETPTKDPLTDNEEFMTCEQLFHIVQKTDNRCLIIDIRPKAQFESSRISSNICINIPETEIKPGVLPIHFLKYLYKDKDKKARQLFQHRGPQYTDVIVLIDSSSTSSTLTPSSHLNIIKQIFEKWDPGIQYNKIVFLDGGYMEWLTRYPTFTTNPNVTESAPASPPNEIFDDIEYPEWLHSDDEESVIKKHEGKLPDLKSMNKNDITLKPSIPREKVRTRQSMPGMNNTHLPAPVTTYTNTTVVEPMEVDTETGDNVRQHHNDLTKHQYKRSQSLLKPTDVPSRPAVDRSSKPLTVKTSDAEIVLKLLKQSIDIAKSKEKLEQKISEQEQSLYTYASGHKDSKEEEFIRGKLKSHHKKLEEVNEAYIDVESELEKYNKDTVGARFTSEEKREKNDLDFNLGLIKRRIKKIIHERKELKKKSIQSEQKSDQRESKEAESNIHKEPLKNEATTMNPGLERSYSSPNLLQERHKAPRVDRSSKPQVLSHSRKENSGSESIKISHVSWANREERMTPVHGSVHPGITGLKNLGNSCYMNSIIQCLSNTTRLAKYFTDNLYIDDINTGSESTTQGQVVEEVAQVIKALWRGQYKSISPYDLKVAVGQYKLQFDGCDQQDSHEFLTFLLDWMHNDLKKLDKITHEMSVAEKAWDKSMSSERSIISDLFFGQLKSTITCSTCKQGSTTYETFNSLTTSLPHSNRCTLNDCILKFVTGQKVVGWKCPKCLLPREATKKFDFVKLAPIIVIHLNRFAESGGGLEKRNTAVEFPLTGFNLKPYVVSDHDTSTYSNIQSYNYSLYAMSNHYGTMDGGHYTAFCKNATQNKWYKYDDQTVTEVTSNQVKSQTNTAYLLFYTSFI